MNLIPEILADYLEQHTSEEDEVLHQLWRETHLKVNMPQMLSGRQQGVFLEMMSRMLRPKRILEIGTYTGYSAICLARGLAEDGELITLDKNDELRTMAEKYFALAGLSNRIKLLNGDARLLIPELEGTFDLVFIDADKQAYGAYLEMVVPRITKGGMIIADNVLWSGKVLEDFQDKDTLAMKAFNQQVNALSGWRKTIVPIRDGLYLIQKMS